MTPINVSFVLPVKDRLDGAIRCITSIRQTVAANNIEIIVVVNDINAFKALGGYATRTVLYEQHSGEMCVHAWNVGTKFVDPESHLIVVAASDLVYLPGWFEKLQSAYKHEAFFNLVDIDTGPRATIHHAITAAALEKYFDGELYPSCYHARYCDNEMHERAQMYGIYVEVPNATKHYHPARGEAVYDEEYRRSDLWVEIDRQTFERRRAQSWAKD